MEKKGGAVTRVIVDGKTIPTDCFIVTMGPWSCMAEDWFDGLSLPMQGVRSTSIVFRTDTQVDPFALFCGEDSNGARLKTSGLEPPVLVHHLPSRVKAAESSFGDMATFAKRSSDIQQA